MTSMEQNLTLICHDGQVCINEQFIEGAHVLNDLKKNGLSEMSIDISHTRYSKKHLAIVRDLHNIQVQKKPTQTAKQAIIASLLRQRITINDLKECLHLAHYLEIEDVYNALVRNYASTIYATPVSFFSAIVSLFSKHYVVNHFLKGFPTDIIRDINKEYFLKYGKKLSNNPQHEVRCSIKELFDNKRITLQQAAQHPLLKDLLSSGFTYILDCQNSHLTSFDGIEEIPNVKDTILLDISNNKISDIPDTILDIMNLKYFKCKNTLIEPKRLGIFLRQLNVREHSAGHDLATTLEAFNLFPNVLPKVTAEFSERIKFCLLYGASCIHIGFGQETLKKTVLETWLTDSDCDRFSWWDRKAIDNLMARSFRLQLSTLTTDEQELLVQTLSLSLKNNKKWYAFLKQYDIFTQPIKK